MSNYVPAKGTQDPPFLVLVQMVRISIRISKITLELLPSRLVSL
jgi:hypothetical protein